jgi:thymidylate synthase
LGLKLGSYKHMVGSLHIYDVDREKVRKFIREGYQSRIAMPRMPIGDPWPNLKKLARAETRIRQGDLVLVDRYKVPNYWADLMKLLQIFALNKARKSTRAVKSEMSSQMYDPYIDKSGRRNS